MAYSKPDRPRGKATKGGVSYATARSVTTPMTMQTQRPDKPKGCSCKH